MKTILTLAIIAIAPICFAQEGKKKGKGGKGPLPAHVIEKFDTNGDGQLDDAEKSAAKAERKAKMAEMKEVKASYDVNGDGELSDSEKEAFKGFLAQKKIERFDEDGDGTLNAAEQAKADEAVRHMKKHKKGKKGDKKQ